MRDKLIFILTLMLMISWGLSTWVIIKLNNRVLEERTRYLMVFNTLDPLIDLSSSNWLVATHLEELIRIFDTNDPPKLTAGDCRLIGIGGSELPSE